MDALQIYVAIAIIILAIMAFFIIFRARKKKKEKLTPLAGLAFVFVFAGIIFGETRAVGYSLMGIGVVLAVIDIIIKSKKNKKRQ
ncbi:MAG TPA: hypothetical protein VMV95_00400 [Bacillota bacterium]|nr:hypothetical protein [Bacillota bacterium]